MALASSGWKSECFLVSSLCTRKLPMSKSYLAEVANSAQIEMTCNEISSQQIYEIPIAVLHRDQQTA